MSVLLGTDVRELKALLGMPAHCETPERVEDALVVTTRAQVRRWEVEEAAQSRCEAETGARGNPVIEPDPEMMQGTAAVNGQALVDLEGDIILGSDFSDDLFIPGKEKPQLSRWEKRLAW